MPSLQAFELEDLLPLLPDTTPLNQCPDRIDLYICALGFEPRCMAIPKRLEADGCSIGMCRYIELVTNVDENRDNLDALKLSLSAMSNDVEPLNADGADFEKQLRTVIVALRAKLGRDPVIVFDITVAANRLLLRTFKVVLESTANLRVVYAEAESYHPTEEEFKSDLAKWIDDDALGTEMGVSSIVPTAEYAGQHLDPLPNCVILFPSFRKDRSRAVISKVDETLATSPGDNIIWILGAPKAQVNRWRTDAMRQINEIAHNAITYEVSTFDYKETLGTLERIYRERWARFNLTTSPLGSKLQAIGTAIFCYLHPDVKVLFAAPKQYNAAEWSIGAGDQWQIKFDNTQELRAKLDRMGSLSIVDEGYRIQRP